jgi:hypothetical protein
LITDLVQRASVTRHRAVRGGRALAVAGGVLGLLVAAGGCRQDMQDQPKYAADAASSFFADGRADRPLVPGTVVHGSFHEDSAYYEGKKDDQPVVDLPVALSTPLLVRGQERYNIYCSPCHDRTGSGKGMIVKRGLRQPPSLHVDRLRAAPAGHFFDVITNGFGIMLSYRAQVPVEDRWAIVAYIRALQLSQNATLADVPGDQRAALDRAAAGH